MKNAFLYLTSFFQASLHGNNAIIRSIYEILSSVSSSIAQSTVLVGMFWTVRENSKKYFPKEIFNIACEAQELKTVSENKITPFLFN